MLHLKDLNPGDPLALEVSVPRGTREVAYAFDPSPDGRAVLVVERFADLRGFVISVSDVSVSDVNGVSPYYDFIRLDPAVETLPHARFIRRADPGQFVQDPLEIFLDRLSMLTHPVLVEDCFRATFSDRRVQDIISSVRSSRPFFPNGRRTSDRAEGLAFLPGPYARVQSILRDLSEPADYDLGVTVLLKQAIAKRVTALLIEEFQVH